MGFKRMAENKHHKKSKGELEGLVKAAEKLGVKEQDIRELYMKVDTSARAYEDMSSAEKDELWKEMDKEHSFWKRQEFKDWLPSFKNDDYPLLGHLQLREHRKQREYTRIAAYELPLLSEYARPYEPPKDDEAIEFQYTTTLGEGGPRDQKVVVRFNPYKLGLTEKQVHKLCLIAGTRYNYTKREVRMSSDKFPEQAQNKRHLADTIKRMIEAARDESDTFEDIPLDTRHTKAMLARRRPLYPEHEFPKEWLRPQDAPKERTDFATVLQRDIVAKHVQA
jgi:small subunit ribosomal protein S35